jgi:hypothetical protein
MKLQVLCRDHVDQSQHVVFNRGEHLCVDLDDAPHHTITVRTKYGKKVAFAFMNWNNGSDGHVECIDIHVVGKRTNDQNVPLHNVSVRGSGPTFYHSHGKDDEVTITTIDLKEE